MEINGTGIPWQEPGWETEVRNWLDARLDEICLGFTGRMEEIHNRPWSTVWKVETKTGHVFFKAGFPPWRMSPVSPGCSAVGIRTLSFHPWRWSAKTAG